MGPNETSKLLHSKANHKQDKKTTLEWEKIFANESMDKGLISKYINSSCNSILKKQKPNPKMGRKLK